MENQEKSSLEGRLVELMTKFGFETPSIGESYTTALPKALNFLDTVEYALEQVADKEGVL